LLEQIGLDAYATSCGVIRPGVSESSAPINATLTAADVPVEQPAGASEKIEICRLTSSGMCMYSIAASSSG